MNASIARRPHPVSTAVLAAIFSLIAAVWLFPYAVLVLTSVKDQGFMLSHGVFALPDRIVLKNFTDAFIGAGLGRFLKNSFLITLTKVPAGIFISALAAYAISKHRFPGRRALYFYFIVGLAIPIQVTLLPLNVLLKNLHLLNSLVGLFLPYVAFGLSVEIMVMRGFFQTVPNEILDSARLDGSGEWHTFSNIMLPLSVPALAALCILDFLWTWNEFLMALIFIQSPQWETLPLGLMYFQGQYSTRWALLCAGVVLGIIPVIVVYVSLQKYFTAGIYAGALKS